MKRLRQQLRCPSTLPTSKVISCELLVYLFLTRSSPSIPCSIGMKKKVELFFFFHINNPPAFKKSLKALAPSITTITQLLEVSTQPDALVNVAFSFTGLSALGVNESLNAPIFSAGQFADAASLGDPGTTNWVPAFKGTNVHGLFILASDSIFLINIKLAYIKSLFGNSLSELHTLQGQVRPGDQEGHERESPSTTDIHALANPFHRFWFHGRNKPARNHWFHRESRARTGCY